MATLVRDYVPADAEAVAALFNRHRDVPNPIDGGITAAQLAQELRDRDTHTFLVAVDEGKLIGTFGLFRSDGRRVAGAGELIADMFFVAPAHRGGMLTAQLFGEGVERMVHSPYSVLRLTVNPANGPAYTLYRRVGCLAVHRTVPGADGNVQLHNFLPLVLRQVLPALPEHLLDTVVAQRTTSFIPRALPTDMEHDVRMVDGRRVASVPFAIGDVQIDTVIDVDNRVVLRADLPGFSYRPEAHLVPPPVATGGADQGAVEVLRRGELRLRAGADGTVEVWRTGHLGPVWTALWPTAGRGRVTGWRAGNPRSVRMSRHADDTVELIEDVDGTTVSCLLQLDASGLSQRFSVTGTDLQPLRAYHLAGLRAGHLRVGGRETPLGDGLGLRDAGQLPAAQAMLEPDTELCWSTPGDSSVRIHTPAAFGLINSTVAEHRDIRDGSTLRLDITDAPARTGGPHPPRTTAEEDATARAPQSETARVAADAGGVVAWKPFGRNVLRAPHPRTRAFANNPRWSAGLWVGAELDRFDRCYGPGWGVAPRSGWTADACGLHGDVARVRVNEHHDDSIARLVVQVDPCHDDPETVLWLTPDCASSGHVSCLSPHDGGVARHELKRRWQRWTHAACIPLRGGRVLAVSGEAGAGASPELLVRCTDSGVLIAAFARTDAGPVAWTLQVLQREVDSFSQLVRHAAADVAA